MTRPTRNDMLMEIAGVVAKRSTCNRLAVGAVISRDARVLSMGYNGPAASLPHCEHINGQPCDAAVHAEANAVAFAARNGIATNETILYVTHSPCLKCSQLIVNAGIHVCVYQNAYRVTDGIDLLQSAGVQCVEYQEGM
jgi:dCMP deaminase